MTGESLYSRKTIRALAVCSTAVLMVACGSSNSTVKTATATTTTTSYSTTTGTNTSTTISTGTATGSSAGTSTATATVTATATSLGTNTDTVAISVADNVEVSVAVTITSTGTGTSSSLKWSCYIPGLNYCSDYNYSLNGTAANFTFSATNHFYYYSLFGEMGSVTGRLTCNHASGTYTWGVSSATITPDTTTATQQSSCVAQGGIYGSEANCSADMSDGHCTSVLNGSGGYFTITFTNVSTWTVP